jgi:hypothetical protein
MTSAETSLPLLLKVVVFICYVLLTLMGADGDAIVYFPFVAWNWPSDPHVRLEERTKTRLEQETRFVRRNVSIQTT